MARNAPVVLLAHTLYVPVTELGMAASAIPPASNVPATIPPMIRMCRIRLPRFLSFRLRWVRVTTGGSSDKENLDTS